MECVNCACIPWAGVVEQDLVLAAPSSHRHPRGGLQPYGRGWGRAAVSCPVLNPSPSAFPLPVEAEDIKVCPRCSAFIMKINDGSCNRMNCTVCGCLFCWLCLQEISDVHFLRSVWGCGCQCGDGGVTMGPGVPMWGWGVPYGAGGGSYGAVRSLWGPGGDCTVSF